MTSRHNRNSTLYASAIFWPLLHILKQPVKNVRDVVNPYTNFNLDPDSHVFVIEGVR